MNEELQKQLVENLKDFSNNLKGIKDFAIEQAPDVIQQMIYWGIAQNVINIIICIVGLWFSYMATFKWSNQKLDYCKDWSVSKVICAVTGGTISGLLSIIACASIYTLVKITVSPKLWILQELSKLIK